MSPSTDSFDTIPVIDLGHWTTATAPGDRQRFAAGVVDVCHRIGFLQLTGHGIDPELRTRYFAALAAFFSLPDDHKATIDKVASPHFRGWERVGAELTDNRTDYREQLDLASEHPAGPAHAQPPYLRLHGPNQWPADHLVPGFRATVSALLAEMERIAIELLAVLSTGLGLDPDHLSRVLGETRFSLAKLIHYPPTPPGEAGVNAHHDAGILTILDPGDAPGLEVQNPLGEWIAVPPSPGDLVVNMGEMLQEMTGNYLVATTHRVVTAGERYSSGWFHGADLDTRLDRLPLAPRFADAVAASPRHAGAGFMATPDELAAGQRGISSSGAGIFGQQLWNYYRRSYPDNVRRHHPDTLAPPA